MENMSGPVKAKALQAPEKWKKETRKQLYIDSPIEKEYDVATKYTIFPSMTQLGGISSIRYLVVQSTGQTFESQPQE